MDERAWKVAGKSRDLIWPRSSADENEGSFMGFGCSNVA